MKLGLGATAAPCCCLAVGTLTLEIASPFFLPSPNPPPFLPIGSPSANRKPTGKSF